MVTTGHLVRRFARLMLQGQVPQHVAFIMDGNRRFADAHTMAKLDGHTAGYSKMVEVIQWCLELGVSHVSTFAFSIDNFQRPQQEVEDLMALVEAKCGALLRDGTAKQWNAQLKVLGDLGLAPPGLQAAAAQLMLSSAGPGATTTVNICFCYTGSHELNTAVDTLRDALWSCSLLPEDITPQLLSAACTTRASPPVDLLIRTSGEQRLSDFLPYQARCALLHWSDTLWPDFGFPELLSAIRSWQVARPVLQHLADAAGAGAAEGPALAELQRGSDAARAGVADAAAGSVLQLADAAGAGAAEGGAPQEQLAGAAKGGAAARLALQHVSDTAGGGCIAGPAPIEPASTARGAAAEGSAHWGLPQQPAEDAAGSCSTPADSGQSYPAVGAKGPPEGASSHTVTSTQGLVAAAVVQPPAGDAAAAHSSRGSLGDPLSSAGHLCDILRTLGVDDTSTFSDSGSRPYLDPSSTAMSGATGRDRPVSDSSSRSSSSSSSSSNISDSCSSRSSSRIHSSSSSWSWFEWGPWAASPAAESLEPTAPAAAAVAAVTQPTATSSTASAADCAAEGGRQHAIHTAAGNTSAVLNHRTAAGSALAGAGAGVDALRCSWFGALSAISEEAVCCCPHPSQALRVQGFLQGLEVQHQAWLEAAASG